MATATDVASGLLQRGASPNQAVLFTAIALTEDSSLDPTRLGDIGLEDATWGPSVGWFQIRSLKSETGTGKTRDVSALTDPNFNLQSAQTISNNWTDASQWTTYTSGKYQANLPAAMNAVGQAQQQGFLAGPGAVTQGPTGPILSPGLLGEIGFPPGPGSGSIPAITGKPLDSSECTPPSGLNIANPAAWVSYLICKASADNLWVRLLEGLVGLVLLTIGLVLLGKTASDASGASSVVKKGASLAAVL